MDKTILRCFLSLLITLGYFQMQPAIAADIGPITVDEVGFEQRYATVNGTRLHYLIAGDGARPVLLIHGFPGSWRNWELLMGRLVQAGYTAIVPDYRGAGESDLAEGGYDKKNMARDLHELMAGLNLGKADIIGHDMGLIIAYAYAAQFPQDTRKLVLMDGFLPGIPGWEVPYSGNPSAGITSKWHFRFFGKTALKLLDGREQIYLDMFFDDFALKGNSTVSTEVREALLADYSRPGRMEAAFKLYSAWVDHDAADNQAFAKQKLAMPLLTLGGSHSRGKTLAEQATQIADEPQSQIVSNAAHWVLEEQTETTRKAIFDFLK